MIFNNKGDFDVYFQDNKVEYKMKYVNFNEESNILTLDYGNAYNFYKGEDYVIIRYVYNLIVYEFGGEILKINNKQHTVDIKISNEVKELQKRTTKRYNCDTLCSFKITEIPLNKVLNKTNGLGVIKDISSLGLSMQTELKIPIHSKIEITIDTLKNIPTINIEGKIINKQIIGDEYRYGIKIIDYKNSKINYNKYLNYLHYLSNNYDNMNFLP